MSGTSAVPPALDGTGHDPGSGGAAASEASGPPPRVTHAPNASGRPRKPRQWVPTVSAMALQDSRWLDSAPRDGHAAPLAADRGGH